MDTLDELEELELEILEHLPIEPNGLSVEELADGLLGNRGPAALGRVRRALLGITMALGEIAIRRGDVEEFGRCDVPLFGICRRDMVRVRGHFSHHPVYL